MKEPFVSPTTNSHRLEVQKGARFEFGKNWGQYLDDFSNERVETAKKSLQKIFELQSFENLKFIDVGSGSGLFSLAAHDLGAQVYSFDYDPESINCTKRLRDLQKISAHQWEIKEGSALDKDYILSLGSFDIVYSWGVLHHTGDMYQALNNIIPLVKNNGLLSIAIYNDQGWASKMWTKIKILYNKLPSPLNKLFAFELLIFMELKSSIRKLLTFKNPIPFMGWKKYKKNRGMSRWHDVVDWVGGYPFEVAKPEDIIHFYLKKGFTLIRLKTCAGGLGCNEYTFIKNDPKRPNT